MQIKSKCAWCEDTNELNVTHGICIDCAKKFFKKDLTNESIDKISELEFLTR